MMSFPFHGTYDNHPRPQQILNLNRRSKITVKMQVISYDNCAKALPLFDTVQTIFHDLHSDINKTIQDAADIIHSKIGEHGNLVIPYDNGVLVYYVGTDSPIDSAIFRTPFGIWTSATYEDYFVKIICDPTLVGSANLDGRSISIPDCKSPFYATINYVNNTQDPFIG